MDARRLGNEAPEYLVRWTDTWEQENALGKEYWAEIQGIQVREIPYPPCRWCKRRVRSMGKTRPDGYKPRRCKRYRERFLWHPETGDIRDCQKEMLI